MRTRTLSTATALAVIFSSAALVAGTAAPAAADSAEALPVSSVGDVVVDGEHQRVYVSDPTGGKIVVTDYTGEHEATVDGLPGVGGLAVAPDSGQVHAAVAGTGRIVSVDTTTYARTASYDLGGADGPATLEAAGGKLWFGYKGGIGSLDVSGSEPVVKLAQGTGVTWDGVPLLGTDPAVPDVLAAGEQGNSWADVAVYDLGGGAPALRATKNVTGDFKQLDLTPDGEQVLTTWDDGHGYAFPAYSTKDLGKVARYPTDPYPNAVAIAPDGTVAGGSMSAYAPDVHVYRPGATTPVREYDFPNTGDTSGGDELVPAALAWAPDGSRLVAVSVNSRGTYTFRAFVEPGRSLPELTLSAPAKAQRGKPLTVTGKLSAAAPLPAGTALTVTRDDSVRPDVALPPVRTAADGTFSFEDTPDEGGEVTYEVAYAGDGTHAAARASASVDVSRDAATLTLDGDGKVHDHGTDVTFTARLGTTHKNRTVEIWADPYGTDQPKALVKKAEADADGNVSATVDLKRDTVVTARYAGDSRTKAATAKSTAYARVKVSTTLARHYRTGTIGSRKYYYFHKNTGPRHTTKMTYYKGRKQRLELQVHADGRWHEGASAYFKLNPDGTSPVTLDAPGQAGIRLRLRSSYVNGTSGDNVNTTTHGAWKYLYFTR
ncbi:YncE family protein [Streptomyces sp. NRRL B-1347]|uniref:YncE family protein n=1 Tax=Streptomyces sp. NRRL B-1347 TaxID=1476877 RepID=UPI0004C4F075|nr:hypothetical protein [Streptomyces sp. NRRL B-1347]